MEQHHLVERRPALGEAPPLVLELDWEGNRDSGGIELIERTPKCHKKALTLYETRRDNSNKRDGPSPATKHTSATILLYAFYGFINIQHDTAQLYFTRGPVELRRLGGESSREVRFGELAIRRAA